MVIWLQSKIFRLILRIAERLSWLRYRLKNNCSGQNILKGLFVLMLVMFILLFLRSILKPRVVRVQERLIREITRVGEDESLPDEEAAIPLDQAGPTDRTGIGRTA